MPTYRKARSRSNRPKHRRESGAVAVEFALILPVLAMILLGTVTTGLSYAHALGLANAVREGARFGAIADASSGSWATNTISRVRGTQFDDPSDSTSVCVQLYKQGTGTLTTPTPGCHAASGVSLGQPATASAAPAVPTAGLNPGQCVVRVIAARKFSINLVLFGVINRTMTRAAVARYEGASC